MHRYWLKDQSSIGTFRPSRFVRQGASSRGADGELLVEGYTGEVPADYAKQVTDRLFPTMLPYKLDTSATFAFTGFNGRALSDDVTDVILTLAINTALGDGVVPDKSRIRDMFPYFGEAYSTTEQIDVAPARPRPDRK
jgi:hypothetical protein